nr:MAG TPA: hypothetical protein [Caudoviricetes sp.]
MDLIYLLSGTLMRFPHSYSLLYIIITLHMDL